MKKICSILLVLSMIVSIFQENPVFASEENQVSVYEGNGYQVSFTVDSQWAGGFQATVEIQNTGLSKIENWCLCFVLPGSIQNIWNAKVLSKEENMYSIKNVGWNQDIKKGDSVRFGFVSSEDFTDFPKEYFMQSEMVLADTESYSIQYTVTSDWQDGFNGDIEIKNVSETCIEDWKLEFDFDNSLDDIWNAEIVEHDETHYIFDNKSYNQNIQPGASVHIGFTCKTGSSQNKPEHFQLVRYDIEGEENQEDDGGQPVITADNAADYVYIDFQMGNTYETVIDDVSFVNVAEDRMKVTWESSDESIVSGTGEVHRQKEQRKVTITAHITIDGQTLEKEFELAVMGKMDIDPAKLKDYSVDELKTWNRGDEDYYCEINDFGYLQTLYGKYSTIKVDSYEAALYSLYNIKSALGITNPFAELQVYDVYTSEDGYTFRFMQMYQGMDVFSNEITVYADENGNTSYIRSSYYPFTEQVNVNPKHSYDYVREQFQKKHPACELVEEEDNLCLINYYGHVDLVWSLSGYFPEDEDAIRQGENWFLLGTSDCEIKYHINLADQNMNAKSYKVSGKDLEGNDRRFDILGKTTGKLFWKKTKYSLENPMRRINIYNGTDSFLPTDEILDDLEMYPVYECNKKEGWNRECVSAMANMEKIYGYFYTAYDCFSYNCAKDRAKGKNLDVFINTAFGDNLQWNFSKNIIIIGEGTGKSNEEWRKKTDNKIKTKDGERVDTYYHFRDIPLAVADDLVCHEFAHAVVGANNKKQSSRNYLSYGVYGILNEAYADVLACCYDRNWTMGEKAAPDGDLPVRDIGNPSKTKCAAKLGTDDHFYVDYTDFGNDCGGVHANSTILSHIFYQLRTKYGLPWAALEKVWMYSVKQIGYDGDADFWDVALNLRKSFRKKGLSDYIKALDKLIAEAGITEDACNSHYTNYMKARDMQCYCNAYFCNTVSLQGKVVAADRNLNLSDNEELEQVKLFVMDDHEEKLTSMKTGGDGMYYEDAAIREKYTIHLQKKGYLDETMYVADINEVLQTEYYCDTVELISQEDSGMGGASGKISDATNARGVGSIKLVVRKGINNIYTEPVQTLETNGQGEYAIQGLEAGNYCLEIIPSSDASYITTYFNVKILGGCTIGNQNGVVSPAVGADQLRVVLTWGQTPRDLDSHMECSMSGAEGHVYYASDRFYYNGRLLCYLDVDDTSSYGPETITLRDDITGSYKYYVYNYSGEDCLEGCGAVVRVYTGGTAHPAYTFHVPYGTGRYWTVFTYNSSTGRIQAIHEIASGVL